MVSRGNWEQSACDQAKAEGCVRKHRTVLQKEDPVPSYITPPESSPQHPLSTSRFRSRRPSKRCNLQRKHARSGRVARASTPILRAWYHLPPCICGNACGENGRTRFIGRRCLQLYIYGRNFAARTLPECLR